MGHCHADIELSNPKLSSLERLAVRAMADGSSKKLLAFAKRYPTLQDAARALADGETQTPSELS